MHEGVSGYGAFNREWQKFQKRAATTAELANRAAIVAREKRTAPKKESDLPWWTPAGLAQRVLGVGRDAVKSPAELKADPLSPAQKVGAAVTSPGLWFGVGLVALAAVMVLRR